MNNWNTVSWIGAALPFMELGNLKEDMLLQNQYTMNQAANQKVRETVVETLICPSNDQNVSRTDQKVGYRGTITPTAAGTDYVGNLGHIWGGWKDCGAVPDFPGPPDNTNLFVKGQPGTPWVNGEVLSEQAVINGCFRYHGSVRLSEVIDGNSNTVMVFEDMHWQGGNDPNLPHNRNFCDDAAWMSPLAAVNTVRNPINNKNKAWLQAAGDRRCHGWSSNHPGGAQCVYADGSTHFVPQNVDHVIRYSIGVRNDNRQDVKLP
jgi:hypothetical protein